MTYVYELAAKSKLLTFAMRSGSKETRTETQDSVFKMQDNFLYVFCVCWLRAANKFKKKMSIVYAG